MPNGVRAATLFQARFDLRLFSTSVLWYANGDVLDEKESLDRR
jgi:hypothetical protein